MSLQNGGQNLVPRAQVLINAHDVNDSCRGASGVNRASGDLALGDAREGVPYRKHRWNFLRMLEKSFDLSDDGNEQLRFNPY
jgi:hypothetical protein